MRLKMLNKLNKIRLKVLNTHIYKIGELN